MFDVVVLAAPARQRGAEDAVTMAGGRVAATLNWDEAETLIDRQLGNPVLLIQAEGIAGAVIDAALPHIGSAIDVLAPHIVVTLDPDQIDPVAAVLLGTAAELLCDAGTGQLVAMLAVAGRSSTRSGLSDRVREDEGERLQRLNGEIARIADLLVRLTDGERGLTGSGDGAVEARRSSFGVKPASEVADPQIIRQAIRARRLRDSFFGDGLFEDPAWDMLLDLYAAHLEGSRVSVSSLCIAAAVAPTTALRWITRLTEAGLVERLPDPTDRRRAFMTLSGRGLDGMQGYVAAARRAGVPIA
ncbi:MarR family transcriptional regulator [Sphingomonas mollis]|nr:MarR family transcriptional regulator [Sphingomonas sp. BT553]